MFCYSVNSEPSPFSRVPIPSIILTTVELVIFYWLLTIAKNKKRLEIEACRSIKRETKCFKSRVHLPALGYQEVGNRQFIGSKEQCSFYEDIPYEIF